MLQYKGDAIETLIATSFLSEFTKSEIQQRKYRVSPSEV